MGGRILHEGEDDTSPPGTELNPVTMRIELETALLALLIGVLPSLCALSCASSDSVDPQRSAYVVKLHRRLSSLPVSHGHLTEAAEIPGGSGPRETHGGAGHSCCLSASESTVSSTSLNTDTRLKLASPAVLSAQELTALRVNRNPRALFRGEQRSPFDRVRAPLLI